MSKLVQLTKQYVQAFHTKNISEVASLLDAQFVLTDPAGTFKGDTVVPYIKALFDGNDKLEFIAKNIFIDGNYSVIEFELNLGDKKLKGIDVIEWTSEGKLKEMRAYVN